MNEYFVGKGACLCGLVQFTASQAEKSIGACHCEMCRKWGSGPFVGVHCGVQVAFQGEESISIFSSSSWAERGFCKRCGSHLFYRLKGNLHHFIPAGLFENQDAFILERQSYIDKKPAYFSFANPTHNMTESEMLKKYSVL